MVVGARSFAPGIAGDCSVGSKLTEYGVVAVMAPGHDAEIDSAPSARDGGPVLWAVLGLLWLGIQIEWVAVH